MRRPVPWHPLLIIHALRIVHRPAHFQTQAMATPALWATNSLLNSAKRYGNRVPLIVLIAFMCFLAVFLRANGAYSKKLKFASSGRYKIAIFADLHYGENAWTDWGPLQDQKSNVVISDVLDRENPDFVVYLGDLLTANNLPTRNATLYWDRAISPTKSKKIPWASVFGNHDDMAFEWPLEWFGSSGMPSTFCPASSLASGDKPMTDCYFQGTTRAELIKNEVQNDLSHSSYGPRGLWPSVSNYVIEIASYKHSKLPAAFLYFLDSGGGSYPEVISASQASWFKQASAQWNRGARVPEVVFWHIPSQAYKHVAPPPRSPINPPCVGSINLESVASQGAEWGILDILTNRTSVKAIVVGHNHGLDWCCPHKSLWLCFARHTGYGGYGNWPRGARILEFVEEPFALESWIRMEDGTQHSQVTLAS